MNALNKYQSVFETVSQTGALAGVALDVFGIVVRKPGLTTGEIYTQYKLANPKTQRSRNELAKRVSDLQSWGVLTKNGVTICSYTGHQAYRWVATGNAPVRTPATRTLSAGNDTQSGYRVVAPVGRPTAEVTRPMHSIDGLVHVSVLRNLLGRARLLQRSRWPLGKRLRAQIDSVIAAMEYFLR